MNRIAQIIYWILGFCLFLKGCVVSTDGVVDPRKFASLVELKIIVVSYGGVLIWAAFNVSKIRRLNYIFLLFAFFFAFFHWSEYFSCVYNPSYSPDFFGGKIPITKPLINTLPFILLLIVSSIHQLEERIISN